MAKAAERNLVIDISGDQMRAVLPPPSSLPTLHVDPSPEELECEHEPETEALDILLEDMQASYTAIVQHLDTCARGLKELDAATRAAAAREIELTGAFERAERSTKFGAALLAELEKLDATGRPKPEVSNGVAESLPTSSD